MCDKSKNSFSLDDFIAFIDSFFVLWEDSDNFRSNVLIYIAVLKQLKDFSVNDRLDGDVQAKFQRLFTLLRNIKLLPVSEADDPAYKDHLIEAKKLWQNLKPEES